MNPDESIPSSEQDALPMRRIAREWAMQYLYQIDLSGEEVSDQSLAWFWGQVAEENPQLKERELRKCQLQALSIIRGVEKNAAAIDETITRCATNWNIDRMAIVDRNILRLSVYEMCFSDDPVPGPISIDEAIEVCKTFGGEESCGFINGILDRVYRDSRQKGKA